MKRRGFSQIELLVAIVVITVGILALIATLVFATQTAKATGRRSEAVGLNRCLLEEVRRRLRATPPVLVSDPVGTRLPVLAPPLESVGLSPEETENFQRNILVEPLSDDPADYRYSLFHVRVALYWDDGVARQMVLDAYQRVNR